MRIDIAIAAVEDDIALSTDQKKQASNTLLNIDMRQYNRYEREKQKSHITKTQHTAQEAVDKMGLGNPSKPTHLVFEPQTLFECSKDADRRLQYKQALKTHINS